MTATNHSARADAIEQVAARFIASEPLSESDRSWIVFALGMSYRSELDAARTAGKRIDAAAIGEKTLAK